MKIKPDVLEEGDLLIDTLNKRLGIVEYVNGSPGYIQVTVVFMGQALTEVIDHFTLQNQYRLVRTEKFEI